MANERSARTNLLLVLCALSSGCGLILHGTTQTIAVDGVPAGATLHAGGVSSVAPNITVRRRRAPLLIRAEYEGQAGCAIATSRMNRLATTLDSIPAAIPLAIDAAIGSVREYPDKVSIILQPSLPSDAEILADWLNGAGNRCLARRPIVVSPGGIDVPYEVLGTVSVSLDDASREAFAAYEQEMTRQPSNATEALQAALIYEARSRFGDRVDAIINTDPTFGPNSFSVWGLRTIEGERSASGVAVRFTGENRGTEPRRAEQSAESVSARLRALQLLREQQAITEAEYERKRAQILEGL